MEIGVPFHERTERAKEIQGEAGFVPIDCGSPREPCNAEPKTDAVTD